MSIVEVSDQTNHLLIIIINIIDMNILILYYNLQYIFKKKIVLLLF